MRILLICAFFACFLPGAYGQALQQTKGDFEDKFRQLDEDLPTPDEKRLASGAPGPEYWQQKVDYSIRIRLNEQARRLIGSQTVAYTNNSPHTLNYLWLQLDQNRFRADSMDNRSRTVSSTSRISYAAIRRAQALKEYKGGYDIRDVKDAFGRSLDYTVTDTNMRIDLPAPLEPGKSFVFSMNFAFNMYDTRVIGGRAGYECFDDEGEDGNCIFLAAQWFPRLHAYTDYEGWNNKQFLGRGEFTLEFGDYTVSITVPDDHVVSSTGVLQNEDDVLTAEQKQRLSKARQNDEPIFIVTPDEAEDAESDQSRATKTWVFEAKNVRDFAWASSRKFIWDAMNVTQEEAGGEDVLAMSFYPKEGEPLWSAYSTKAVAHTIKIYSRYSFAYPYPTAQSVNGPVGGMEYPMITFNGPRPVKGDDGNLTYSRRTKYGLISVIIHEIGHIYFPMVVNSDERQWTWMDEGLNTFLQFVAEAEWEEKYPSRRGEPAKMVPYMISTNQVPIMTQSDSVLQFGANAYGKPATALVILRETILGREAFDRAFREYAQRWKFKRPTPSDFFRTMEEASGVDLDWFWRGWFYSTDHVDISIDNVVHGTLDTLDPRIEKERQRSEKAEEPVYLSDVRNADVPKAVEEDPSLLDFYNENDEFAYGEKQVESYEDKVEALEDWEREALTSTDNFYYLTFSNRGGLVMPIIIKLTYEDGETEIMRFPAEIWRRSPKKVTKLIVTDKVINSVEVDPLRETADAERENNYFPPRIVPSRLEVFKRERAKSLMERLGFVVSPDSLEASKAPESDDD